jgi:signal transduction histidine kinase
MDAREAVEFELYFAPTDEWVEAHAYPSPSGLSVYYRNISARRRAEEAAREADQQRAEADRRLDLVLEAERSRIARDLHDEALQGLAHALVITGSREAGRDGEVAGILQQVERQLRAAIYDLRLEPDGERPFSAALRELVEVAREMRPGCDVTLETGDDLPGAALERRGTEVLRIVREAVNNACRHATAERIVVRAMGSGTRLVVEVTDDGRGFYPARQTPALQGQGLRGMRERAELLEADLDVRSDRTGTTVRLQLDLGSA